MIEQGASLETLAAATSSANNVNADLVAVLALGAAALIIFTAVYVIRRQVSATFSRIYALIAVATLGVGLGFASISDTARTAGFTLLGTIAGYLAGATTKTASTSHGAAADHSELHALAAAGSPPQAPSGEPEPTETYL